MKPVLELRGFGVGTRVRDVNLTVNAGEFVGLIGPNGAGKTTLLRAILSLVQACGHNSLDAVRIADRSRHVSYLAQDRQMVWPISVQEVVALGAKSHPSLRASALAEADRVLRRLGMHEFATRTVNSLSGGERAQVLLARALAQNAPLLLADEPCAALDPAHSLHVGQILRAEAGAGKAVIASLHDLPLAARYCSRVLVMKDGSILADGPPTEVLTPALMAEVFGIDWYEIDDDRGQSWVVREIVRADAP